MQISIVSFLPLLFSLSIFTSSLTHSAAVGTALVTKFQSPEIAECDLSGKLFPGCSCFDLAFSFADHKQAV